MIAADELTISSPILVDFGLSRIIGARRRADVGTIVGAPAYMLPQQGLGREGDARIDVWQKQHYGGQ